MAGREDKIMIRINGEIKEKFSSYCDEYGMTMSAMAAFLIGQWVRSQEQVTEPMIEAIKNSFVGTMEKYAQEEIQAVNSLIGNEGKTSEVKIGAE